MEKLPAELPPFCLSREIRNSTILLPPRASEETRERKRGRREGRRCLQRLSGTRHGCGGMDLRSASVKPSNTQEAGGGKRKGSKRVGAPVPFSLAAEPCRVAPGGRKGKGREAHGPSLPRIRRTMSRGLVTSPPRMFEKKEKRGRKARSPLFSTTARRGASTLPLSPRMVRGGERKKKKIRRGRAQTGRAGFPYQLGLFPPFRGASKPFHLVRRVHQGEEREKKRKRGKRGR